MSVMQEKVSAHTCCLEDTPALKKETETPVLKKQQETVQGSKNQKFIEVVVHLHNSKFFQLSLKFDFLTYMLITQHTLFGLYRS